MEKQMEDGLKLLEATDKIIQLGEKGLARVTEADDIEKRLKDFLNTSLDFDSIMGRKYDKWNHLPHWKIMPRDNFALRSYIVSIQELRGFLTKFLDASDIKAPPTQKYIKTGEVFTGRRIVRDILTQAKEKIAIQDNYIDLDILAILQPYLENNSNLEVRLLTGEQVKKDFLSDFSLFATQFGNVFAKKHDKAHGRFIIIDSQEVFSIGHSLKDVGKKADLVSKVEDKVARKAAIEDFEKWWIDGKNLILH